MKKHKKILFISADQWRAECLSAVAHPVVSTPHLDRLAADGVLFRQHYTQAAPCGPARASLLSGLYAMNHRSIRNGTPLDARHTNVALEARKAGLEPVVVGYTDTSLDPRGRAPNDPDSRRYQGIMPGFREIVNYTDDVPYAWLSQLLAKGYPLPEHFEDIYLPAVDYPLAAERGHSVAPPVYRAADSDTAFMTDQVLDYLRPRRNEDWFVHLIFLRPQGEGALGSLAAGGSPPRRSAVARRRRVDGQVSGGAAVGCDP
jgi:arylsulfatase A-like enzyme